MLGGTHEPLPPFEAFPAGFFVTGWDTGLCDASTWIVFFTLGAEVDYVTLNVGGINLGGVGVHDGKVLGVLVHAKTELWWKGSR